MAITPEILDQHQQPAMTKSNILHGRFSGYDKYRNFTKDSILNEIAFDVSKVQAQYVDKQGLKHNSDSYSIIRDDNGHELGTVSKQYELIEHNRVLEPALEALSDLDYVFKTVAMKNQGGRVLIEAASPNQMVRINNEDHLPRVVIKNSYDASCSVNIQFGFFRMVCTNGIIAPEFKGSTVSLNARHSASAKNALDTWVNALSQTNWIAEFKMRLEALDTPMRDKDAIVRILGEAFSIPEEKLTSPTPPKILTQAIQAMYFGQGQSGDLDKTLTKWDVFNGITETLRDSVNAAKQEHLYSRINTANQRSVKALNLLLAA